MPNIVIADLGTGNLQSVRKAVTWLSDETAVCITDDATAITQSERLILPGQGALGTWFNQLDRAPELEQAIRTRLATGPVLGICLGLQALYQYSEENQGTRGLQQLAGSVKHFTTPPNHNTSGTACTNAEVASPARKIPHIGWNKVRQCRAHPLWHGIADDEWFYFVHSYYVDSEDTEQVAGRCQYGHWFTAAAAAANVFATQFHPEKSQQAGLTLLKNFIHWNGEP